MHEQRLAADIATLTSYVDDIIAGKREADPALASTIAAALSAIPPLPTSAIDSVREKRARDLLALNHLAALVRTQATIAEKLVAIM